MVLPPAFVVVAAAVVVLKVVVTGLLVTGMLVWTLELGVVVFVTGAETEVEGNFDVAVGAVPPLQLPGSGAPSVGLAWQVDRHLQADGGRTGHPHPADLLRRFRSTSECLRKR
jgi:hypothetical protein